MLYFRAIHCCTFKFFFIAFVIHKRVLLPNRSTSRLFTALQKTFSNGMIVADVDKNAYLLTHLDWAPDWPALLQNRQ